MASVLDDLSAGLFKFTPVFADISVPDLCDVFSTHDRVWAAAAAQGLGQASDYYSYLTFYPRSAGNVCGRFDERAPATGELPQGGLNNPSSQWVPPNAQYSGDPYALSFNVILHEYLHTLGLLHSNSLSCAVDGRTTPFSYDGKCRSYQYDDQMDIMGQMKAESPTLNAAQRDLLGWLPASEVVDINGDRPQSVSVDLPIYANPNEQPQVVRIDLPSPVSGPAKGREPGTLYLSSQRVNSYPWPRADGEETNVMLRWNASDEMTPPFTFPENPDLASSGGYFHGGTHPWPSRSDVIEVNQGDSLPWDPSSIFDYDAWVNRMPYNSGVRPGDSWSDPTGRVRIDYLEESGDGTARVTVTVQSRTPVMGGVGRPTVESEGDAFRVSWPASSAPGETAVYRVEARSSHSGKSAKVSCEAAPQENSCTLPRVYAHTRYEISVTPTAADGITGPISETVTLRTELPSQPYVKNATLRPVEGGIEVTASVDPFAVVGTSTGYAAWWHARCVDAMGVMPEVGLMGSTAMAEAVDQERLVATLEGDLLPGRDYECTLTASSNGVDSGPWVSSLTALGRPTPMTPPQIATMSKFRTAYRARINRSWQPEYPTDSLTKLQVKCVSGRKVSRASGRPGSSIVKVYGLIPGRSYNCYARQTRGDMVSGWSAAHRLHKVMGSAVMG